MAEEFVIEGVRYRATPMDARIQLHVCRRVAPLLSAVPEVLASDAGLMEAALPLASALAGMDDKEVDYVLDKCLSTVQREVQGDRPWANVWNSGAQRPMFEDINMVVMLKITARVILDTIGPFLSALAPKSNGAAGA